MHRRLDPGRLFGVTLLAVLIGAGIQSLVWPRVKYSFGAGPQPSGAVAVPPEPPDSGAHQFGQRHGSGDPVGWYPCRPIPYWIGRSDLPPEGEASVARVLGEVTAISGQRFKYRGLTDTIPQDNWDFPVRGAWIGWTSVPSTEAWADHEGQSGELAVGLTSVSPRLADGWTARGWVMVKTDDDQAHVSASEVDTLRHEVGHLLGLDHTDASNEAMTPATPTAEYGPGDRRGLWLLGPSRGCGPTP
jgi:hypothetical protein